MLILLFPKSIAAQGDSLFLHYKKLNDSETRLPEFKDSDSHLKLKLQQLQVINQSRQKFKVANVQLDILASRAANKMSKEAAENNFNGHFNQAGEKPYHRYAFAGGKDHVSENAAGYWTTGQLDADDATVSRLMKEMHGEFMAEKSPNDGHKKNCIEKIHNYVGIGFYLVNGQFRYYEEFVDRYYTFISVLDTIKAKKEFILKLKPQQGQYFYCLFAYYEKALKPMSAAAINRTSSYADFTSNMALDLWPADLAKFRKGEQYEIKLKFTKPGIYYIQICQDGKEYTKAPRRAASNGKLQASGIVIVVE
ncbi:MAG: CAP domain-containing protein [Bacteroidetes bacterium]|nr:CAP domain-containing protein [Bacteroidota bacterium]